MEQALPELAVFRELHEDEHDGDGEEDDDDDDDEDKHHDDDDKDDNGLSQSSSLMVSLLLSPSPFLCPRPMTVSLFWPLMMIPDVRVKRNWQQHPR